MLQFTELPLTATAASLPLGWTEVQWLLIHMPVPAGLPADNYHVE